MTITVIKTQKKYTLPCYIGLEIASELNVKGKPQRVKKNKKNIQVILLNYANVPKDIKGWVDCAFYLPPPYEICSLFFEDGHRRVGWWGGSSWFCRGMEWNMRVIKWRRNDEGARDV